MHLARELLQLVSLLLCPSLNHHKVCFLTHSPLPAAPPSPASCKLKFSISSPETNLETSFMIFMLTVLRAFDFQGVTLK